MAKASAELKFRRLGKLFLWNQATMMTFCCVRYCTLSEARDYWRNKAYGAHNRSKMVGMPCAPTPLIRIMIFFPSKPMSSKWFLLFRYSDQSLLSCVLHALSIHTPHHIALQLVISPTALEPGPPEGANYFATLHKGRILFEVLISWKVMSGKTPLITHNTRGERLYFKPFKCNSVVPQKIKQQIRENVSTSCSCS
jgi:hypothetical protein